MTEYNFVIHDGNKQRIIPDSKELTGPWLPRWMSLAQQAIRTRGGEVEAADHLERWVADHGAFEDVVHRPFWFQASPWNTGTDPDSHRQNEIAKVMREDMLVYASIPPFLSLFCLIRFLAAIPTIRTAIIVG